MEEKGLFDKIAVYIFVIGLILIVFILLNTVFHGVLGSKIPQNQQ